VNCFFEAARLRLQTTWHELLLIKPHPDRNLVWDAKFIFDIY
jgi:hypothetical protein